MPIINLTNRRRVFSIHTEDSQLGDEQMKSDYGDR